MMGEKQIIRLRGVLFRCTIRGGHASLATIVTKEGHDDYGGGENEQSSSSSTLGEKEERMVLVIVRLGGPEWKNDPSAPTGGDENNVSNEMMTQMRSNIKRMCKMGNEMEFLGTYAESTANEATNDNDAEESSTTAKAPSTDWRSWDQFMVDYHLLTTMTMTTNSSQQSQESAVRVCRELFWNANKCQTVRAKYFISPPKKQQQTKKKKMGTYNKNNNNNNGDGSADYTATTDATTIAAAKEGRKQSKARHHGGGIGKRKQGEIVADFLLWVLSTIYLNEEESLALSSDIGAQSEPSPDKVAEQQSTNNIIDGTDKGIALEDQNRLLMERWVPLHPSISTSDRSLITKRNAIVAKRIDQSHSTQTQTKDTENEKKANTNNNNNNGCHSPPNNNQSTRGIIDAAGGAGHVSLALALRAVRSTVVDPRSTVGRLPGRDRKALKRSKRERFSTYRAWFGSRPEGVDSFFRERGSDGKSGISTGGGGGAVDDAAAAAPNSREYNPSLFATMNDDGNGNATVVVNVDDPTALPICSMCSEDKLLPNCVAIVALHPDEATGSIVETAVENEIPFVAVPCCVFSRLFPDRIRPSISEDGSAGSAVLDEHQNTSGIVSTYYDLIDWLVAKHPAIKVTRLPFDGANIAVWATFK